MSSRSLGTLTLNLIAKTGSFEHGMDRAARSSRRTSKQIGDDAESAAKRARAAWALVTGIVAGAVSAISVGALYRSIIQNTQETEKVQAQLAAVLRSTGEAAGYNRDQMNKMAEDLSRVSVFSTGEIAEAQINLSAFSGIVGEQFPRALRSALDMASRTGMSVAAAAELIGRALDVPSKGLTALTRQGFKFNEDQKRVAEHLEATGRSAEAQAIILEALEESYEGAALAARETFGGAVDALRNNIDGLLTGKEGSLEGARIAIEELNTALSDPATRAAFESLVTSVANGTTRMVQGIPFVIDVVDGIKRAFQIAADIIIVDINNAISMVGHNVSKFLSTISRVPGIDFTEASASMMRFAQQAANVSAEARKNIQENLDRPLAGTAMAAFARQAREGANAVSDIVGSGGAVPPRDIEALARRLKLQEEAEKAAARAGKALQNRFAQAEMGYLREIALLESVSDTQQKATELAKLGFEIESGRLVGINAGQQKRLESLAEEIDALTLLNKKRQELRDTDLYVTAIDDQIKVRQAALDIDIASLGIGRRRAEQLREINAIQGEYAARIEELARAQGTANALSQEAYESRVEALRNAMDREVELVEEAATRKAAAEASWVNGAVRALEDYSDRVADVASTAESLITSALDNMTARTGEAFEAMIFDAQTLDESIYNMAESMARSVINALGQMAAQWLAYQVVQMLVGKNTQASAASTLTANAYAGVYQAGINAFASTAAIPIAGPPAAPAAMAAAIATTMPMAAAVGALSLSGMAHEGIDSIPQTGTWLLEKGERVTTAETSAKLDRVLEDIRARQYGGGERSGGWKGGREIHQHYHVQGALDQRTTTQANIDMARRMRQAEARLGR